MNIKKSPHKPESRDSGDADSFTEVIQFAIEQEIAEYLFYTSLAERADNAEVKAMMLRHAKEEMEHREKLREVLASHHLPEGEERFPDPDLKIADYLVARDEQANQLSYQDALILAIKMEQANQNLYQDFAQLSTDRKVRKIFAFLAEQEGKHKRMLEREYDDNFLEED